MIKVASAPLDMDLGRFSAWLLSQGVYHRIVEEAGEQWVLMREDADHDAVREVLTRYLSEPAFQQQLDAQPMGPWRLRNSLVSVMPRASWREAPVMYLVLAFALLVGLLTGFGDGGPLLRALLIIDPFQVDHALRSTDQRLSGLMLMLQEGQLWRLVSPDFLHFSIPHFIFNALMIWYLGGQLEARKGSIDWVVFFIAVSLTANIAQLFDAGALFGGLSGVVYGLVAYTWLWKRSDASVVFPDALLFLSVAWLLLGYTSFTAWVGLGNMANSAHLFGLLAGAVFGIAVGMTRKPETQKNEGPNEK